MKILLIFLGLSLNITLFSQLTPQFVTTIWVEDALGNRDSIEVGYDTTATSGIDIEFGELQINSPFDSILDLRVYDFFDRRRTHTKKTIGATGNYNNSHCLSSGDKILVIWAKYQPITFSWSKEIFSSNECHNGSLFSNHYADLTATPYPWNEHTEERNFCMADTSFFTIYSNLDSAKFDRQTFVAEQVEGLGTQQLATFRHYTRAIFAYTPACNGIILETNDVKIEKQVSIYPNPATDLLQITSRGFTPKQSWVYDLSGKQIAEYDTATNIDVSLLTKGVYFLQMIDEDGNTATSKFLKM